MAFFGRPWLVFGLTPEYRSLSDPVYSQGQILIESTYIHKHGSDWTYLNCKLRVVDERGVHLLRMRGEDL
jgi:hypothetical protein